MPRMELKEKCEGQLWEFQGGWYLFRGCGKGELFHDNTEIFKNFLLCLIFHFRTGGTKKKKINKISKNREAPQFVACLEK